MVEITAKLASVKGQRAANSITLCVEIPTNRTTRTTKTKTNWKRYEDGHTRWHFRIADYGVVVCEKKLGNAASARPRRPMH